LKEAGAESLRFQLLNRNVDLPLKYVATWLIDEWSKIGLHVTQRVCPTGPRFDAMRSGNFDVVLEANGHGLANPPLDVQKYLPASVESENYLHLRTKRRSRLDKPDRDQKQHGQYGFGGH
jgi:peptide/nickel transport system substrate-binding protein